ncbi:hypothetical protein EYF80_002937 [Liparis tanakae]|uniref:Uncharacterized protein n=1 Tax=Liparis tanakae TaxID=230148 RepID=A0A4Z2JAC4_9TELE|nr:hypothetical protein EYF80_002937 [Liparis tanakae]
MPLAAKVLPRDRAPVPTSAKPHTFSAEGRYDSSKVLLPGQHSGTTGVVGVECGPVQLDRGRGMHAGKGKRRLRLDLALMRRHERKGGSVFEESRTSTWSWACSSTVSGCRLQSGAGGPASKLSSRRKKREPLGSSMRWERGLSRSVSTRSPSLDHSTVGVGRPSALQLRVAGSPLETMRYLTSGLEPYMALPARLLPADRDRAAAERDSLPLISSSPVFNTAACHSVSTSRVAEQIKSHLRAWTGTIRRCVKLPDSKLNYFRRNGPVYGDLSMVLKLKPKDWQKKLVRDMSSRLADTLGISAVCNLRSCPTPKDTPVADGSPVRPHILLTLYRVRPRGSASILTRDKLRDERWRRDSVRGHEPFDKLGHFHVFALVHITTAYKSQTLLPSLLCFLRVSFPRQREECSETSFTCSLVQSSPTRENKQEMIMNTHEKFQTIITATLKFGVSNSQQLPPLLAVRGGHFFGQRGRDTSLSKSILRETKK